MGLRHHNNEYEQKFLSTQNIYHSLLGCVTLNDLQWVEHKMAAHVGLPLWSKLLLSDYWEVNNLYLRDFKHILVFELLLFLKAVLWYTDTLKFRTVASQWKWKLVGVNSEYTKAIGYFSANGRFHSRGQKPC